MHAIAELLWLLFMPALALAATRYSRLCATLGAVVLAYLFGMFLATMPFFGDANVHNQLRDLAVPLAIPLLLFNLNARQWLRDAKPAVLGFSLAIISVLCMAALSFVLLGDKLAYPAETLGMLTGMYIGGTPNMAVVHQTMAAPESLFIQTNAVDVLFGGVGFLMLISIAGRLYGLFLRPYSNKQSKGRTAGVNQELINSAPATKRAIAKLALAVVLATAIVGLSVGISQLFFDNISVPVVMLLITSLSVLASSVQTIRSIRYSYDAGYYLVLIFCVAIGASVDLAELLQNPGWLAAVVCLMFFGSLLLHALLAKLFRLDRDTTIITATAALFGPPFVPPVANALRNPALLLSGLTTGLVGYAIGNYLGIAVAYLARHLLAA